MLGIYNTISESEKEKNKNKTEIMLQHTNNQKSRKNERVARKGVRVLKKPAVWMMKLYSLPLSFVLVTDTCQVAAIEGRVACTGSPVLCVCV